MRVGQAGAGADRAVFLDESGARWRLVKRSVIVAVLAAVGAIAWFLPRALTPDPAADPRVRGGDTALLDSLPDQLPVVGRGEMLRVFRIEYAGASVVLAGDSVPCASLDELAAGAGALVHTVIRKDLVEQVPLQRLKDILDYHSSVEEAAATATRAGVGTLILTHYVPPLAPGQEEEWRARAASAFDRQIELGDDLHRVEVHPGVCARPAT